MIRFCDGRDFEQIWAVINEGATAYEGVIPEDRLQKPYMSREKLERERAQGVVFWGYEDEGLLVAVMGIQPVEDVWLIRHAYVRPGSQKQGIGSRLLVHLLKLARGPILIGAWAHAGWAIAFYQRHGFALVGAPEKDRLLRKYWDVPDRQIETSVVLADPQWVSQSSAGAGSGRLLQ